jgi:hypothetical protein
MLNKRKDSGEAETEVSLWVCVAIGTEMAKASLPRRGAARDAGPLQGTDGNVRCPYRP